MRKNSRSPSFVQLALRMMKFRKWSWKLYKVNPQRLVLTSPTIEGPENTKGKQAIQKTCNYLGALRGSRQVMWMSVGVALEEYLRVTVI